MGKQQDVAFAVLGCDVVEQTLAPVGGIGAARVPPVAGPLGLAVADEHQALAGRGCHSARRVRRDAVFLAAGALRAGRLAGGPGGSGSGAGAGGGANASGAGGSAATAPLS